MTCTVIVCQMEMSLTAAHVSPGKTPVAGEGSPQCAHLCLYPVSSCSVCLSWSPEICSGKEGDDSDCLLFSLLDLTRIDVLLNEEEEAGDGMRNARLFQEDLFWFSLWLHLLSPPSPHPTLLPPNTHTHGNLPLPAVTFWGRGCHVKSWERVTTWSSLKASEQALQNRPAAGGTLSSPSPKS